MFINSVNSDKLVQSIRADHLKQAAAYRQANRLKNRRARPVGRLVVALTLIILAISVVALSIPSMTAPM